MGVLIRSRKEAHRRKPCEDRWKLIHLSSHTHGVSFLWLLSQLPQTRGLKKGKKFILLQLWKQGPRNQHGLFFSGDTEGLLPQTSLQLLVATGNAWLSLDYRCITSAYALLSHGILSVYPDFPLKRALVLALEAQLVSPHLHLTNHTCKDPVSKQSHIHSTRVETWGPQFNPQYIPKDFKRFIAHGVRLLGQSNCPGVLLWFRVVTK